MARKQSKKDDQKPEPSPDDMPLQMAGEGEPDLLPTDEETAPTNKKIEGDYNANESLRVLKGLEAVRERPGMYIGDTGPNGLHHLFKEIIDNSIDEVLAGHCNTINIVLAKDYSLSVEDNGRGIPVDVNTESGKTGVELVLTELHAGGKFGGGGYKVSGGLHGVGASCVNALSEWMECEVKRDGKIYRMRFERGIPVTPLKVVGKCGKEEHGTKVTWLADDTMFAAALNEEGHLAYNSDRLRKRISELAYLNKEVSITFDNQLFGNEPQGDLAKAIESGETEVEPGTVFAPEVYHYKRGIAEYVAHLNAARDSLHGKVVYFYREREGTQVEIALQYNKSYSESIFCFANNIYNADGGTHLSGFKTALTRVINTYARKNNFLKANDTNFSGDDVREGLTAVISVRLHNPMFNSQDKVKLMNIEVEGMVSSIVGEGLTEFMEENPQVARAILDKASTAARAREAARRAAELVKRQSALEGSNLPGKLADCSDRDPRKCEIYIVEGDSAGGCFSGDTKVALMDGRNVSFLELIAEQEAGLQNFCYTIRRDGTVGTERILNARRTKQNAAVIRVTLDNGEAIICTPDHRFMLRDGSYKAAGDLSPYDALMPHEAEIFAVSPHPKVVFAEAVRTKCVETLTETIDVYDIEVPGTHNFALASGVFVHNSAKQGRDRRTQAVLPLRGKIICVEKARIDKALDNEAVKNLISALGVGIALGNGSDDEDSKDSIAKFDISKLRYHKIIIMADADVDGDHIRTLLLNFFFRYMKPLVDLGHIYVAQPPLYAIRVGKDEKRYVKTEAERDRVVKEIKRKDVHITRFKGLGEMNPEDLADTTMNPEYRTLAQVVVDEDAAADQMFTVLMGEKVEPRRAFIEKYAREVTDIDAF